MHEVEGMSPWDVPGPPTAEEVATRFAGTIFTLAPQATVREAGWGTVGYNDVVVEVSASYSVFRHSADPEDPANFIDGVDDILRHIRAAESAGQPEWFLTAVRNARYPMAWEAVHSTRLPTEADDSLSDLLVNHLNHVLLNSVEGRRTSGLFPPELDRPAVADLVSAAAVHVDGTDIDGLVLDSDTDAIGWAAKVGNTAVSLVLLREFLPLVDPRLQTRRT